MILALADERAVDPRQTGAKASWLARALHTGLPVLEGFVVPASASLPHLRAASEALARRGSGAARLEAMRGRLPEDLAAEIRSAGADLGPPLVVRSSSVLEGSGEWAGAFASYLELSLDELGRGVLGCWASAFGPATLERFEAAGTSPDRHPMAVLIQRAVQPDFGGTARLEADEVRLVAVPGSPAPLVQGWTTGVIAVVRDDRVEGDEALEVLGPDRLRRLARTLREAATLGATTAEWALCGEQVWILQLGRSAPPPERPEALGGIDDPRAAVLARLVRRFPGPLGEQLVLPWAVADPMPHLDPPRPLSVEPGAAWQEANELAARLIDETWAACGGRERAMVSLRLLRGTTPEEALDTFARLRPADPEPAGRLLALLDTVARSLEAGGKLPRRERIWHLTPARVQELLADRTAAESGRIGFDRWEPFQAAVTMGRGTSVQGVSAGTGLGAGRLRYVSGGSSAAEFRAREVVVARDPLPHLAPLLWDAAALVTVGGSPAAHLFESARALGIPAVCSVDLTEAIGRPLEEMAGGHAAAVDGWSGTVYVEEW